MAYSYNSLVSEPIDRLLGVSASIGASIVLVLGEVVVGHGPVGLGHSSMLSSTGVLPIIPSSKSRSSKSENKGKISKKLMKDVLKLGAIYREYTSVVKKTSYNSSDNLLSNLFNSLSVLCLLFLWIQHYMATLSSVEDSSYSFCWVFYAVHECFSPFWCRDEASMNCQINSYLTFKCYILCSTQELTGTFSLSP